MDINGLDELIDVFNNASDSFNEESSELIDKIGKLLLSKTVLKTPVDTGKLKKSWKYEPKTDKEGIVYTEINYAPYLEYGHRTRGGKSFVDGRYMLTKSVEEVKEELGEELEIMVENLFR